MYYLCHGWNYFDTSGTANLVSVVSSLELSISLIQIYLLCTNSLIIRTLLDIQNYYMMYFALRNSILTVTDSKMDEITALFFKVELN